MNAVELERIASSTIPPVKATGLCLVVDQEPCGVLVSGAPSGIGGRTRFGPAWIIDAHRKSAPIALFERQADAHRLLAMLRGDAPAPRSGPDLAQPPLGTDLEQGQGRIEAPDGELPGVSLPTAPTAPTGRSSKSAPARSVLEPTPVSGTPVRLCAGCYEPLPADSRPNRTAHNAACRERARYRRAAERVRADADGGAADLTLSTPGIDPGPNPTSSTPAAPQPREELELASPSPAP